MYSKFFSIDKDKQERIINASLAEFSLNGYDKASTNVIVKTADISKGILFHYFNNKKQLYLFLYDYSMNLFINDFYQLIDFNEKDLLLRLKQIVKNKMIIIKKYPLFFKFLEKAYLEESNEVKHDIFVKNQELNNFTVRVFEDIDLTKFKADIDIKAVINIMIWSFEGYSNQVVNNSKLNHTEIDYEKAFLEVENYMVIFKKCFYK